VLCLSNKLRITNYELRITNYGVVSAKKKKSEIAIAIRRKTNCILPTAHCQLPIPGRWSADQRQSEKILMPLANHSYRTLKVI
jgi:hypothetical protein